MLGIDLTEKQLTKEEEEPPNEPHLTATAESALPALQVELVPAHSEKEFSVPSQAKPYPRYTFTADDENPNL